VVAGSHESPVAAPRPRPRPGWGRIPLTRAAAAATLSAAVTLAVTGLALGAWMGPAGAATTTTTTKAAAATTTTTTTTTTAPSAPTTPADKWVLKAIADEQKFGSVRVAGKITQGKSVILLDLLVNGDGEGGGDFVQQGTLIKIERVGPLLYFNAPTKFWSTHATAAQTKEFGGKWIEFSAVDSRFTSFDQFLDAADLVTAVFDGHTTPLTVSRPTTFDGHKVVIVKDTVTKSGKKSTGLMYIATKGPAYVYKIVNDTPGEVSTIVFTHYGKGVTLTVPPNAINLS
jgi:hypothetical protein